MQAFHRRLAEIGLATIALAGGDAISANGMGDRPSEDDDLFTNQANPDQFASAATRLRNAYQTCGLHVEDERIRTTFAEFNVTEPTTGEASNVQLGLDFRAFPPATLDIGPVLDPRDAVGSKMSALWSRGEARDFIDIDTVVQSGQFSRSDVLTIADQFEAAPLDRPTLAARFRQAARHDERAFARYGVNPQQRTRILINFAQWADDLESPEKTSDIAARPH